MSEFKKQNAMNWGISFWRQFKAEFSKAISLSKKMLHAGKTNVELKDTLSELGLNMYKALKTKDLSRESQEIQNLMSRVDYLEQLMNAHEGEIKKVKARNMPSLSK